MLYKNTSLKKTEVLVMANTKQSGWCLALGVRECSETRKSPFLKQGQNSYFANVVSVPLDGCTI